MGEGSACSVALRSGGGNSMVFWPTYWLAHRDSERTWCKMNLEPSVGIRPYILSPVNHIQGKAMVSHEGGLDENIPPPNLSFKKNQPGYVVGRGF